MASINKIQISNDMHHVSISPNNILEGFTSYDELEPTSFKEFGVIAVSDTIGTIFSKLTKMVSNIRYLLTYVQENKALVGHTHTSDDITEGTFPTSQLPIAYIQVQDDNYIPTSDLIYDMNQEVEEFEAATLMGEDFTSNYECGGILAGTTIKSTDRVKDVLLAMVLAKEPSTEYEDKKIGVWDSTSDVDTFFTAHTFYNGWSGLKVGNYVTIQDGTYNIDWVIAGFNCEYPDDASSYGNIGGIVFIPRYMDLCDYAWNEDDSEAVSYMQSDIDNFLEGDIYDALNTILGDHIISRDAYLGNSQYSSYPREGTTSSTSYNTRTLTLMSTTQLGFTAASYNNENDDGEANYKLPLFNHIDLTTYYGNGNMPWFRNVYGIESSVFKAYKLYSTGEIGSDAVSNTNGIRPLIYLR